MIVKNRNIFNCGGRAFLYKSVEACLFQLFQRSLIFKGEGAARKAVFSCFKHRSELIHKADKEAVGRIVFAEPLHQRRRVMPAAGQDKMSDNNAAQHFAGAVKAGLPCYFQHFIEHNSEA